MHTWNTENWGSALPRCIRNIYTITTRMFIIQFISLSRPPRSPSLPLFLLRSEQCWQRPGVLSIYNGVISSICRQSACSMYSMSWILQKNIMQRRLSLVIDHMSWPQDFRKWIAIRWAKSQRLERHTVRANYIEMLSNLKEEECCGANYFLSLAALWLQSEKWGDDQSKTLLAPYGLQTFY